MRYKLLLLIVLVFGNLSAQTVVINEVMASNGITILDENFESPDWIEFYNFGNDPLNLEGFWLSDDPTNLKKWAFPNITIFPNDYRLVFASDKNRRSVPNFWNAVTAWGDSMAYFPGLSQPPSNWNDTSFNDSSWAKGPSGFGFGDGDDSTQITEPVLTVYARSEFEISDVSKLTHAIMHIDYDDGFVAFINGVEIARDGVAGNPPSFNEPATRSNEAEIQDGEYPTTFVLDSLLHLFNTGKNVFAVQVHNVDINSSDLTLIPFLTLGLDEDGNYREPQPIINDILPRLHTNFRLSASGETIYLSDSASEIIDSLQYIDLQGDLSWGHSPDGSGILKYFDIPTPLQANSLIGYNGFTESPLFSLEGGFFTSPQLITLTPANPNDQVFYTTDGSEPSNLSQQYATPFFIDSTKVVRTKSFSQNQLPSQTVTHTFFINVQHLVPIISISSNPDNFFDTDSGIYVLGNDFDPDPPNFGANFWKDWERPVNIEYIDTDGSKVINQGAGIKIFGGYSRSFPQKSLVLFARGQYGKPEFEHKFFKNKDIDVFQSIVLRNSGNDFGRTMFRDGFIQDAVAPTGIDRLGFQPAIVYLNGKYWGLHNIREKINEHFIASNNNIDSDSLEILELDAVKVYGEDEHYESMIDYLQANSPADSAVYAYTNTQMDIDNFITYQVIQIYSDNRDWPGNNIKYWRPSTNDGRWRWILFDTDFGFNIFGSNDHERNTIAFALDANGPGWPNPPWSTFLFRRLSENSAFRNDFINRSADFMNTIFRPDTLLTQINEKALQIVAEINSALTRWDENPQNWNPDIDLMRDFATYRPRFFKAHLMQTFNISDTVNVKINLSDENSGFIHLNSLTLSSFPFNGTYFKNIPIELTAVVRPGYNFVGWSGAVTSNEPSIVLDLLNNIQIVANFQKDNTQFETMIINEINYNSSATVNPEDWVELLNNSNETIDLSGWQFKDDDDTHIFEFPSGFTIEPDSFIVICRDSILFSSVFPNVNNYIGQMDFGFSGNSDILRLYNASGEIVDSVEYDDEAPWPIEPDGNGPTLSLKNPFTDNSLAENWTPSLAGFGTPGAKNDISVSISSTSSNSPKQFALYSNYPNPFNPSTTIQFDVPVRAKVKITVYDVLGKTVKELTSKIYSAGQYEIQWQPNSSVASGMYFLQMKSNNFSQTQRMIFMK